MKKNVTLSVKIVSVIAILIVNLIAVELASIAVYYIQNKAVPWNDKISSQKQKNATAGFDSIKERMTIHPYFGALTIRGLKHSENNELNFYQKRIRGINFVPSYFYELSVNNHGFWSKYEFPYKKQDGDFVIGLFGGSVAFHLGNLAIDENVPILQKLKNKYKRIVILNFASGGLKQPQQVLILSYFLSMGQQFDYIINVDGFNEAYVGWLNIHEYKIDYSMPCGQFLNSIQNAFLDRGLGEASKIASINNNIHNLNKIQASVPFASIYYITEFLIKYERNAITKLEQRFAVQRKDIRYPIQAIVAANNSYEIQVRDIANMWFESSCTMNDMARAREIPYMHVLQPNQYFPSKKIFSEQELKEYGVLEAESIPLKLIVPLAYKAFLDKRDDFKRRKISFIDATQVFNGMTDTVYIDWACHINDNGNIRIANLIESVILGGGNK